MTKRRAHAQLIKQQLAQVAGIPLTPPRLYLGPTQVTVLKTDPTKYSTGPLLLCQHRQPAKWCVVCAERRGH